MDQADLTVVGGSVPARFTSSAQGTTYVQFGASGTTNYGQIAMTGNVMTLRTSYSDRVTIGASGQVGIGGANYGTDGQVLTSQGASAAPQWEDAGGGAYEVFASASFSSVSEIEFTSIPSGPFKIRISTHEFSGGENFRMLFAVGGAYLATNYVVSELYNNYSTANGYHLNGQTYFRLTPSSGGASDTDSHNFWEIDFLQPEAGSSRRNLVRVHKSTAAGSEATVETLCGFNTATGSISKFKVYPSGGTITGKYTIISHV